VLPFAATLDPKQLQRFKNEAQAAAGLHHTNIVPVYFVGCERGVHFYAMQLIDGRTLAAVIHDLRGAQQRGDQADLDRTSPYTPAPAAAAGAPDTPLGQVLSTERSRRGPAFFRAVARLGVQAAEALEHAHQLGVIHRDVKPGNLMVDGRGNLWITDFGLAHCQSQAGLTMTGDLVGTLRYMSPEQALAQRVLVDQRTDVYSLGATLYELLTLEPAFAGNDRQEVLRQVAFEEPRPPRRLNKAIPRELETIVLKALEKSPAERYAIAQELADDLERFLKDESIQARRPTLVQRARKWARRHPSVVWSAAIVLVLTAVVSLLFTARLWQEIKFKKDALDKAEKQEQIATAAAGDANAIADFVFSDFLDAATPERQLGSGVTVLQMLNEAEPKIETAFADRPLVKAGLRHSTGSLYLRLGRYRQAERHLSRAYASRAHHLGADHPVTLQSMHHLGLVFLQQERKEKGLEVLAECLERRRRVRGLEHPETIRTLAHLAVALEMLDRLTESQKLHEECLELCKQAHGPKGAQTLAVMNNLAIVLRKQGRLEGARKLTEEVLALRRQELGKDHPDALRSMINLAVVLSALGKWEEAWKLEQEALRSSTQVLGRDHPDTLKAMFNVAISLRKRGQLAAARRHSEEALRLRRQVLGLKHPLTLRSMHEQAELLRVLEKFDDARKLNEQCLRLRREVLGPEHPATLNSMNSLATVLEQQDQLEAALDLQKQAFRLLRRHLGREHPDTLASMGNLATVLTRLERWEEARILEEELLEMRRRKAPDSEDTRAAKVNLFATLYGLAHRLQKDRRHKSAARAYRRALELQEELLIASPQDPRFQKNLSVVCFELVELLIACPDEKARDPKAAVAVAKKALERGPRTSREACLSLLGRAHYRAGEWQASVQALDKTVRSAGGPGCVGLLYLAMAHWKLGNKEQANRWFDHGDRMLQSLLMDERTLKQFAHQVEATRRLHTEAALLLGRKKSGADRKP
jgi:serine/threonine protein kinase